MPKTLLVTGGAGIIGSNFVHRWHRGHLDSKVVVLDALTYAADPARLEGLDWVELVQGDIHYGLLTSRLLKQHGIREDFHFAAESHVDRSIVGPAAFIHTNLVGTFTVLEAARTAWAGDRN